MKRTLLFGSVCIILQGCAGMKYTPMTQQTRDAIKVTEAYNLVIQDEAKLAVKLSNVSGVLGGGLLAAAIDSSINDDRAMSSLEIAEPLLNNTLDLNYRKLFVQHFNPVLVSELNVKQLKQEAESVFLNDKEITKKIASLKEGEAFLYTSTFYQFFDDFKVLQFETVANLYIAKDGKRTAKKPDYRNSYIYISDKVGSGLFDSIQKWNDNDAELYKKTIAHSITQTKSMFETDIKATQSQTCISGTEYTYFNVLGATKNKAIIISKDSNRVLLRDTNGHLVDTNDEFLGKSINKLCKA